jgi:hypothetical protein
MRNLTCESLPYPEAHGDHQEAQRKYEGPRRRHLDRLPWMRLKSIARA